MPSQVDEISQDHGPKFLSMSTENRKLALRLHKNLGHPEPAKLCKILQQRGYTQELSRGIMDLKCSVCQTQQRPKLQRPSTLKEELEFGDKVAMDGVKWTNRQGQEFHFYHFIDYGTNYHTAVIAPNRAEAQERLTTGWLNWAGPPNEMLLDSATGARMCTAKRSHQMHIGSWAASNVMAVCYSTCWLSMNLNTMSRLTSNCNKR